MTCKRLQYLSPILVVLLMSVFVSAQVPTGTPAFGSFGGGPFDVINLATLNVHFSIPIVSKAGRGLPFSYAVPYDSSVWYPAGTGASKVWTPVTNFGWPAQQEIATGKILYTTRTTPCFDPDLNKIITVTHWDYTGFREGSGTFHKFLLGVADDDTCGAATSGNQTSSDGSGYILYADMATAHVTSRTGWGIFPSYNQSGGSGKIVDSNGNYISANNGVFTDTLGKSVMTVTGIGTAASPLQFVYSNPVATTSTVVVNYTNFNIKTNFGCSGVNEFSGSSIPLATSIVLPDSTQYTITYEPTPGFSGYYTGRIASITLPTGGKIDYAYTGSNNGIVCSDGSAAGLTRTINSGGGVWSYSRSNVSGNQWVTTITDPQANDTKINFQSSFETSHQSFQGTAASGTLLQTTITCYNHNNTSCDTTGVVEPVLSKTVTLQLPGGKQSQQGFGYDTYGLLTSYGQSDFGDGAPGPFIKSTTISYLYFGGTSTGYVIRPYIVTTQGAYVTAQTAYNYDESGINSYITGDHNGGTALSRHFTYYDTGMPKTSTDVNGAVTTYIYGSASCGNSFITEVDLPISTLKRYLTWDSPGCTGAVVKTAKDESGNTTTYDYADANYWRITKVTDPLTNFTTVGYPNVNSVETSLTFGSANVDSRMTVDGFGRPRFAQRLNAGTTYDSVETDYDPLGRPSKSLLPFSGGAGLPCAGTCPGTTFVYDPLNRTTMASDAGGGDVSYDFTPGTSSNNNDVLVAIEPAPSGTSENTKRRQLEVDGLGRLKSVCEVTSGSGSGACTQSNAQTGFFTQYSYDALGHLLGVSQNAQSAHPQGRTFTYDLLGRMTSETNPETGTTNYTYDSATGCTGTYNGDLVKRVDAKGNTTCYAYDSLRRVTSITYSGPYTTPAKTFVYDSATVNGAVMANVKGRLAEAFTGPSSSKATDLGFSYNARGELIDVYQSTPHSGTPYYHITAAYWPNGALNTIQNLTSLPIITYGLDGEGRPKTVSASTGTNPVSNTVYNTASQVTEVDFGSLDKDTFQYDSNTGRMTEYKFIVGTPNVTGDLTWNANGTLKTLAITDGLNSADTQICTYGYDDLARVASSVCGTA